MKWKNFGETTTEEGHKVFFSGKEDKHKHGVGFLISCSQGHREHCPGMSPSLQKAYHHPPESRPFQHHNSTKAYAPTSDYDDNEIEEFYDQLQNVIDQTSKKDILVVQGDWDGKVGKDACGNWQSIC